MKTKTKFFPAATRALLAVCILIVPLLGCNFFGIPNYELTVTIQDGVQGTPGNGTHSYKELTAVDYKYVPDNTLHTVEIEYDGARYLAEGSFIVYTHAALEARLVDIRDTWTLSVFDDAGTSTVSAEITFSGADILGGTFSDSRGLAGAWDGASNTITITYADWENFVLTGTLFSMNGTWTNGDVFGTWSAVRKE